MIAREGLPSGEPGKKELPVTSATKEKLVGVLDRWGLESVSVFPPEVAEFIGNPRYTPLSGEQDGVPVDIDVLNLPEGNPHKPNLRWVVVLERGNTLSLLEEYSLRKVPDGYDLEYHERVHTAEDQAAINEALDNSSVEELEAKYGERERSIQQARELDMAGVSEHDAHRLIMLLETSKRRKLDAEIE